MKKIFATLAAVLFVLSFAASAFAIHAEIPADTQAIAAKGTTQIILGGEIRTRAWWRNGLFAALGQDPTKATDSDAWYDQRIRLSIDAQVSPNVQGFIQLESSGSNFDNTNDKYVWGTSGGNSAGSNAKPKSDFNFLQAWILYKGSGLFGFNSGLKIGHMPLALGEKQFFDHTQMGDDALVFFMDPSKAVHIGLLTAKFSEGAIGDNTDDVDAYVGLVTWKWNEQNTVGLNYTYANLSDIGLAMSNIELHGNGKFGNFGYKAQVDFQFGNLCQDGKAGCTEDVDFSGWAAYVAANYNMNPVNFRGSFAYGSGNDGSDFDENTKRVTGVSEFVPFVGNVQNYAFIYEYQHATTAFNPSGLNSAFPSNGHAGGIANTIYVNLGLDYDATKEIKLGLDGYYFWASKTGSFEKALGKDVSDTGGWEIDAKLNYRFAKNLTYQLDIGYFDPGSFYEDAYNIDTKGVTALRNTLTLSF